MKKSIKNKWLCITVSDKELKSLSFYSNKSKAIKECNKIRVNELSKILKIDLNYPYIVYEIGKIYGDIISNYIKSLKTKEQAIEYRNNSFEIAKDFYNETIINQDDENFEILIEEKYSDRGNLKYLIIDLKENLYE